MIFLDNYSTKRSTSAIKRENATINSSNYLNLNLQQETPKRDLNKRNKRLPTMSKRRSRKTKWTS